MADMTKKHFVLIQDCINESIKKIINDPTLKSYTLSNEQINPELRLSSLETRLKRFLYTTFAEKLKYTNDSFDKDKFVSGI